MPTATSAASMPPPISSPMPAMAGGLAASLQSIFGRCERADSRSPRPDFLTAVVARAYAWLARIVVVEKALDDRVEIIEAETRTSYYQINPSGRVPYLVDDAGVGIEDGQLICAYLDSLDGKPRFHGPLSEPD
jgi:hypothetical protein